MSFYLSNVTFRGYCRLKEEINTNDIDNGRNCVYESFLCVFAVCYIVG